MTWGLRGEVEGAERGIVMGLGEEADETGGSSPSGSALARRDLGCAKISSSLPVAFAPPIADPSRPCLRALCAYINPGSPPSFSLSSCYPPSAHPFFCPHRSPPPAPRVAHQLDFPRCDSVCPTVFWSSSPG